MIRAIKKSGLLALCVCAMCFGARSIALAENYVNWGSEYYFTIPENWRQIERFNVDNFLTLHGKNPAEIGYDVFVCPKEADPFYSLAYVFVTSDTTSVGDGLIDSVFAGMKTDFAKAVKEAGGEGPISRFKTRAPKMDKKTGTLTQIIDLNAQGQDQVLMIVMKFYHKGLVTFYCYTTSALFEEYEPQFVALTNTFSDKDLESAGAEPPPKIVKVSSESETVDSDRDSDSKSGTKAQDWAPYVGVFVVLMIILLRRRKRKSMGAK